MPGEVAQMAPQSRRSVSVRDVATVRELLMNDGAKKQLSAVASHTLRPERMMRVISTALRTNELLGKCDPLSFLGAMMTCASLGLEPNTPLGHAYLIPFKNRKKGSVEVQLIIGYKGLLDLARRSGHIHSIHADVVYSDDTLWEFEYGSQQRLRHMPGPREGEKLYAYAYASLKDGGEAFIVLPWSHVLKIRDGSQGYQTALRYDKTATPWIKYEDEMAAKTAIRALSKRLPLSIEMAEAVKLDEERADFAAVGAAPAKSGDVVEVDIIGDDELIDQDAPQEAPPAAAPKPTRKSAAKPAKPVERTEAKQAAAPPPPAPPEPEPEPQTDDLIDDAVPALDVSEVVSRVEAALDVVASSDDPTSAFDQFYQDFAPALASLEAVSPEEHGNVVAMINQLRTELT